MTIIFQHKQEIAMNYTEININKRSYADSMVLYYLEVGIEIVKQA